MDKEIQVSGKFKIKDIKVYDEIVFDRGYYKKAQEKAEVFLKLIINEEEKYLFKKLYNYHGSPKDIYNNKTNKKEPYQTLRNINTLLCLLFDQVSDIKIIIKFLNNFEIQENYKKVELIDSFHLFVNLVMPHIESKFQSYNFSINPKSWKFIVVKNENCDSKHEKELQAETINEKETEKEFNNIDKGLDLNKNQVIFAYFFSILPIPLTLLLFYSYYLVFGFISNPIYFSITLFIAFIVSLITSISGLINSKKINKKSSKKSKAFFSLGMLICIGYVFFKISGLLIPDNDYAFVLDPADRGTKTGSIKFNFDDKELDVLDVNNMIYKDTIYFYVSVSYQNATLQKLTNVHANILYTRNGNTTWTSFETVLYASKGNSVLDKTYIKNLPNSWKIEAIEAHAQNAHGKECGKNYDYDILLNVEKLTTTGVNIPDLDIKSFSQRNKYYGACSQGAVIAKFRLIKL